MTFEDPTLKQSWIRRARAQLWPNAEQKHNEQIIKENVESNLKAAEDAAEMLLIPRGWTAAFWPQELHSLVAARQLRFNSASLILDAIVNARVAVYREIDRLLMSIPSERQFVARPKGPNS